MKERRDAILKFIESRGEITLAELAAEFGQWSAMTLRRDLASLADDRKIILTRGGARVLPARYGLYEDVYSERETRNFAAKQRIGRLAAELVEPGKGIFLDSGTTVMELAKLLPDRSGVVITSGANIALEVLARKEHPSVMLLGGTLARRTLAISDPNIEAQLSRLNIDTAFMGASGFDEHAGFSVGSEPDAMLKAAVIARARRIVMLLDSSKVGVMLPFSFASMQQVDVLISDAGLPDTVTDKYKNIATIIK